MITISPEKGVEFHASGCQQCGACVGICPVGALASVVTDYKTGLAYIHVDRSKCISCGRCAAVCPATAASPGPDYLTRLPQLRYRMAHNSDPEVCHRSSSGGAARTIIVEALRSGAVDGVYALGRSDKWPYTGGRFWTAADKPAYDDLPNSVYHTVMACTELARVRRCERLMIVGTSCQIRALRIALKGRYDSLISVVIFCKQQKHYGATRFMAKACGAGKIGDQFRARYRGDGWPGTVSINGHTMTWSRAAQLPFGRRLWSVPGCNICGDPFGLDAGGDLALMDPWEISTPGPGGDTLVTVMTDKGARILDSIRQLEQKELSYADVKPALGETDIRRKQALVPYYRGEECSARVKIAGYLDRKSRQMLGAMLLALPRLPMIIYRIICKLPDPRNILLR